ncbi:hypothetical protein ABIA39_001259 [Nocardia sp. GAS34]|uniref:hypothetical protein n=1 Tax=unclassified Nocardia TaxID=2637762 RepID=UPI003D1C1861
MTRHFDHYESRTPAPGTVAAWLRLGTAPSERVPWWAAQWLADGHDGPALRELAGLNGREPRTVRDLLPAALAEAGVELTMTLSAAASEAFGLIAELHLTGQASALWVAQQVEQIVFHADYDAEVQMLPLAISTGSPTNGRAAGAAPWRRLKPRSANAASSKRRPRSTRGVLGQTASGHPCA